MHYFAILCLLFLCITNAFSDEVVFLDLQDKNQHIGDAIIIHSGNKYAMIDVGYRKFNKSNKHHVSYEAVSNYLKTHLKSQENPTLEWILFTHNHPDHTGGIIDLVNLKINNKPLKIKKVFTKHYNNIDMNCKDKTLEKCRKERKDTWNEILGAFKKGNIDVNYINTSNNSIPNIGNFQFKLFNTRQIHRQEFKTICDNLNKKESVNHQCNENANSIIVTAKNKNRYYYFSGDIASPPKELTAVYKENFITDLVKNATKYYEKLDGKKFDRFDVFKASHHGFKGNNGKKPYNVIRIDNCIITTKYDTTSYSKIDEVLDNITNKKQKKVNIFFSGAGDVVVTQNNNDLKISQSKDTHGELKACSKNSDCKSGCCFMYGKEPGKRHYCVTKGNYCMNN